MKPVLLLIPGTLCDARVFERQRHALRACARLRLLDYRALRDPAAWAEAVLQRLPERFSVAGFSLGGIWALELLRLAPERVERIALIASNAQGAGANARRRSARLRRLWRRGGPQAVVHQVEPAYFHHARNRRRHAPLVSDMARATRRDSAFAQFAWAATRQDGHAALAAFGGPVCLVSGARDGLCPRSAQHAMLAAQPRARWTELARVGHFLPLEAPARLGDVLRQWLLAPVDGAALASPPLPHAEAPAHVDHRLPA